MDHGSTNNGHGDHISHISSGTGHEGHGDDHGGHGGSHNMSGHAMMMHFHFRLEETVLFSFWKTESVGSMVGSVIFIMFMAALYEGLKYYRERLNWRAHNVLQYNNARDRTTTTEDRQKVVTPTMFSWMHIYQSFLHIVQMIVSYFLMLIFMTYNVWLCSGVVLGAALGYFFFGWKKSVIVDVTEHCH